MKPPITIRNCWIKSKSKVEIESRNLSAEGGSKAEDEDEVEDQDEDGVENIAEMTSIANTSYVLSPTS